MSILKDFEQRLGGAVEGFFARVFRSGLQPVELAKAVQRYAQNFQQVGVDGVFVPNVYRFELAAEDHERFSGFADSLKGELAGVVKRTATDRGWRLQGPVRIELLVSDDVRVGTYELRGKVEAAADHAGAAHSPRPPTAGGSPPASLRPAVADGATRVLATPAPPAGFLLDDSGRRFPLGDATTVGRLPECDVTLDDPSVSRRHARITRLDSRWSIEDLGSTNGITVNGRQLGYADLSSGDRVEFGSVRLQFQER